MGSIRVFLVVEVLAFGTAALTHFGFLFPGYAHRNASIAETVITVVLLFGFAASSIRPSVTPQAGLLAQSFALLATLIGLFTIAVGVGPRTVPDVVYHIVIVMVLLLGIVLTRRVRRAAMSGS
ncbi:MAG: hypothetical protein ACJ8AJ_06530 [Gemmatimonadaceae bacterium]